MSVKVDKEYDKRISKKLSFLLRHGAVKKGITIRPDGFVKVSDILKEIPGCSVDDIQRIVATNDKQRFTLQCFEKDLMIKANQGHTIGEVDSLSLRHLTHVLFDVIHGTYLSCYEQIKSQGLSRMRRNHIHFAKGLNFICGLRKSAEIFIYINFEKASQDGIKFYESENNVILSPGNANGYIEPKYFLKVTTKSGQNLL